MVSAQRPAVFPLNVIVLYGGHSSERAVSLESGACVADALRERGHEVHLVDTQFGLPLAIFADASQQESIVLPMVHGAGGEDGVLQRQLDRIGVRYLGSSAEASALTFNKIRTQLRLQQSGLPTPPSVSVRRQGLQNQSSVDSAAEIAVRSLGFPLVVKPAEQGSSIGVTIVRSEDMLRSAIELAFQFGEECLIEQFIDGREITVAVCDGVSLPSIEICPGSVWFDYDAKYHDEKTRYVVNPPGVPEAAVSAAVRACRCCGVSGISRVDLRLTADGRCYLLEINTIPGMTSHSLVPMAIRAAGSTPGQFLEECLVREILRSTIDRAA
ncbi:MAG: D-alanine--D-alanine ligase [Planctomyces sp.]|nr:D-alanine--D-alanine ligase [Planctomyces sp.]